MAAHAVTVSTTVAASPERLWQVITEPDAATLALLGVTAMEPLTDGPYTVGTRWRETRPLARGTRTREMRVVESVPPHRTSVVAAHGGVEHTTTLHLSSAKRGTRLTMAVITDRPYAGRFRRWTARVGGRMGIPFTRTTLRRKIRAIRRAAENS